MLDIGWTEIATIVILAILVIGPKDLPKAMKSVAKMIGKVKAMMREFQNNIDDMIKETELDEVKKQIQSINTPDFKNKIMQTVDKDGELAKSMDLSKEAADFNKEMADINKSINTPSKEDPPKPEVKTSVKDALTDQKTEK
jgi:sec-independent protein translocase protein TatB